MPQMLNERALRYWAEKLDTLLQRIFPRFSRVKARRWNLRFVLRGNDFCRRCPPSYGWQPAYVVPMVVGQVDAPQFPWPCSQGAHCLLDARRAASQAGIHQHPPVAVGYQ